MTRSPGPLGESGNRKAGKPGATWRTGFGPSENCSGGEAMQAPPDRVRRQRSRPHRRERGSQSGCPTRSKRRFIPGDPMSARTIVMPSDQQSAGGKTSDLRRRGPGSTPTALLSANRAVDDLSSLDDSEELPDDLLRRFQMADPLPWWHGGLNE